MSGFFVAVQHFVGLFRCDHIWMERVYSNGPRIYSWCLKCHKKRKERLNYE